MSVEIEESRPSTRIKMDAYGKSYDKHEMELQVEVELNKFQQKMVYMGSAVNTLLAIFFVGTGLVYSSVNPLYLGAWFLATFFCNVINIGFTWKNRNAPVSRIKNVERTYHFTVGLLAFVWGCVGLFSLTGDPQYHLYVITYLQIALVGFCFGTITDFTACVICAITIVTPYVALRVFSGFHSLLTTGNDPNLNITYILSLIIITFFLLIVSYVGYRLIRKFFMLSFEKIILSQQLSDANLFLEERIKERTVELEDSLKLVTYQSTHDSLTDLPNHRLLLEHIDNAMQKANRKNHYFAIIHLSLNEIRKINEAMGQDAEEIIIKTIAQRFKKKFENSAVGGMQRHRFTVTLSRKDIFVILLEPILDPKEVEESIQSIYDILQYPVTVEKHEVKLTASIGASIYPRDSNTSKNLLKHAATAMLHAQQQGGNSLKIYTADSNVNLLKQLELESRLHTAVQENEFVIHYQPIVDLRTGRICAAEALVRWKNPVYGFIPPDQFIPLAESNGVIIPLGEWVFRNACKQTKMWKDMGILELRIGINLSSKQLYQKNLLPRFMSIMQEVGLDPHCVEIELTESVAFQPQVIPNIKQFKSMGLRLAIDDFGTGYSGLSNLKLFAIDTLKIDKSFVKDVINNNDSKAIVGNVVSLAKNLNVEVLAEGVETYEQLQFLQNLECDLVQGYYFSPPVDAEMFTEMLRRKKNFIY